MTQSRKLAPLAVGIALALLIIAGLVAIRRSQGHSVSAASATAAAGLEIRNPSVKSEPSKDGSVQIQYELAWTTDTYPGTHACAWSALDAHGNVVGTSTTNVTSLRPRATDATHPVEVSGEAVSAEGSCDSRRLDTGDPYAYDFQVQSVKMLDETQVDVTYSSEWLGAGYPGAVSCVVRLLDSKGGAIASHPTNILIASGQAIDEVKYDVPTDQQPVSAEIADCKPFTA